MVSFENFEHNLIWTTRKLSLQSLKMELIFFDKIILSFTVFENDIDFVLTDRAAYITVMKICKLMLTTVSHAKFQVVVEACSADPQSPNITQAEHSHALILQQALQFIPNPGAEVMTRTVGLRLGQQLLDQVL